MTASIALPRLYPSHAVDRRGRAEGPRLRGYGASATPSTRALTGVESPVSSGRNRSKIDWLTYTFQTDPDVLHVREHLDFLRSVLGPNVVAVEGPGMLGYDHGARYFCLVEGQKIPVARLDFGGNHYKGRGRFDLSGTGCGRVLDWSAVVDFISLQFAYRLTRVDVACDLLDGQFTVEDCVDWYRDGDFTSGGRTPDHFLLGDWLAPRKGRTFEVGRRVNGKMLRAYEKGRQLGDADSSWTRFEVEFRNIDRDLTLDMLIDPDRYFVGAYRCLQRLIDVVGEKLPTHQKEGEICLEALIEHARTAYGKCIHVMRLCMTGDQVLDSLSINGVPARLEKAAVGGFLKKPFSSERIRI